MSKRGLGKGLDALFATSSVALAKQQAANQAQTLSNDGALRELAVSQLQSGKYQPRKDMADEALAELTESIRAQGIIQPIIVRELTNSHFEIIAGERRWRAARQAGLKQVPCIVKSVDDRATMAIALIENIQREDLNVMEEAQALERLQSEFSLTHQQLAQAVGKSRTAVSNLLRLNQLATEVKHLVETKQIEMGHARALLALPTEQQLAIAQIVVSKALTVRETEALVKKQLEPQIEAKKVTKNPAVEAIENRLSEQFGTPVAISKQKNGKGKIVISFDQDHELQQILDKIGQ
ncbi:TPA: ParB/RepB/Spo0J family partition protein [Photobacterium damselae]|uniref:Probable chromosome-partitioning protein ParB n=1 Tax=Photobacterium damselae TaxID=38293 RepID=A0ABD6WZM8_PHODM|nr:ParB/RepB/Spo0J family partition protein [Photobacterium damselae]EHA1082152.1 ParB/RepB/Spo0J family partition protein [Photobacterium damselae]EJN6961469.1 ParB/RepB/Spo0J family partition protein [Photobacterium damselae]KAB1512674.1 ParB/RepB/Spo0J family partition protein [Photobacterium damselae subsp. damselae]MCG9779998.1 ParB/RepB/Spo0J family partition protein [Photobacterium damselae]NVO62005.1 ParB/RepB/Spo0J family partition protein [Photobacterium damselae subsp. damselae]